MILGGGALVSYSSSYALGVNPSAASGTVFLDNTDGDSSFTLSRGDYVVYSFGAVASFYGVVSKVGEAKRDPSSGLVHSFEVLDNRVRLAWQAVFGIWNMEDEMASKRIGRPGAPSAPGDEDTGGSDDVAVGVSVGSDYSVDFSGEPDDGGDNGTRRRRYWSILPQHWASGIKTWHDSPFNAREILNSAFANAWGDFGFSRNYHPDLADFVPLGLDHRSGVRLSNLIADINGRAGLDMYITGSRTLVWVRKGEGFFPIPDVTCDNIEAGESLAAVDTGLRVVGERVRIQVCNVELEPDWKPGWEKFIDEVAWRREVASVFSMPVETKANQADISAKAREVTVYQYAKAKDDAAFLDYRPFGRGSRANMPAWSYIQELVFRSYRIPPNHTLYGVPVSSLEMADTLLVGTDVSGEGAEAKQAYVTNPVEFYPSAQAQVIHKGQPLDFLQARDVRLFYLNARSLREEWTVAGDYEVDPVNLSVRFAAPVFVDGSPSEGKSLYLRENKGEGGGTNVTSGVAEGSDYLDVVVPNPNAQITAAGVKGSFCFLFGNYYQDYGVGPRRGPFPVQGLGLHLIDTSGASMSAAGTASFNESRLALPSTGGASFREILYEDGGKAEEKADAAVSSALGLSPVQATGGFHRHGSVATGLSGVVDRVTVRVDANGITEEVTYTKARATGVAFSERTLQRIQRTDEVFPGQEQLRNEARQYRMIAAAERRAASGPRSRTHRRFADVFSTPIGSEVSSTQVLYDKNSAAPSGGWKAGHVVWLDKDGWPSKSGTAFGGVLVSKPAASGSGGSSQAKELCVATAGRVPVRVGSGIQPGAPVFAEKGDAVGKSRGSVPIGRLAHAEKTPGGEDDELLALVDLAADAGDPGPFDLLGLFEHEGKWLLRFSPGRVLYNEIHNAGVFQENSGKGRAVVAVVPVIQMDGRGSVKLDDDDPPGIDIGSKTSGKVWIVCHGERCSNRSDDSTRMVLTDRDDKPEEKDGEVYVPVVSFDVVTTSGKKKLEDVEPHLQSDWPQSYLCEDRADSSDDSITSEWPSSLDVSDASSEDSNSSDDSGMGSDPSGDSDGDSEEGNDCDVAMIPRWENWVSRLPADPKYDPGYCVPAEYTFDIRCQFYFKYPFGGQQCLGIAYGVKCQGGFTVGEDPGSDEVEYKWRNDTLRTLKFRVPVPPACNYLLLTWRVKTFGPVPGFGGVEPEDPGCCDKSIGGISILRLPTASQPYAERQLPGVEGEYCGCSSSEGSSSDPPASPDPSDPSA